MYKLVLIIIYFELGINKSLDLRINHFGYFAFMSDLLRVLMISPSLTRNACEVCLDGCV